MREIDAVHEFVARWHGVTAGELSTAQSFILELCDLLGVDRPHPTPAQDYMFERPVDFHHGDGTTSPGRVDCYRRGHFVLESKKLKAAGKAFDDGLLRARTQAENYARALPADEGRPPFVIVVDVGNVIELYAEFTRSGATYTPYPDPRSHRIRLADLEDEVVLARLRTVWTNPLSLDPSRVSAKVTREVAERLAEVARVLEGAGHAPQKVAGFLTRCLFSMFAEDVGLLPKRSFVDLLESLKGHPAQFVPLVGDLWRTMDGGGFCVSIRGDLLRFNGKLFKSPEVLPLDASQIDLLLDAAKANWREVEPAIFGTLLERALDPEERHALGAHYTPRAYVERLVVPTVVEPLRDDWKNAQAAALVFAQEGKLKEAQAEVRSFLHKLAHVRVLDPACGSGNFLYVTLEHLKRLEGEVLNQLDEFGDTQGRLDLAGVSVDPHQLLGIELNPRASEIAEMVLWIGYLQWHFRTRGQVMPPQPVLKDFRNIECRDAVLAYDRVEFVTDERGVPVTRWDGRTMKIHPVTGEDVPDESARVPIERYVSPRKADWPDADFVVGNPPFIGNKRMRDELGKGYVEALRASTPDVPDSADLVMYWWDHAAGLARDGRLRRFGLITTNSFTMIFNRRVAERHLGAAKPLSIVFAVPDHPWVDSADGADVRIAMTVAEAGSVDGVLMRTSSETPAGDGAVTVTFEAHSGRVHSDLRVGANVTAAVRLRANDLLSNRGVIPHGEGFLVTPDDARRLGLGTIEGLKERLRPYRNGKDMTDRPRGMIVIDTHGLTEEELRASFPAVYQHLFERVRPERSENNRKRVREKWWLFAEARVVMRRSLVGLRRYIVTGQVAKHRVFQFLDSSILPDDKLIAIALEDAVALGILSSEIHRIWALAAGGRLGVGNDPVYSKSTCFEAFPFPDDELLERARVRELAEHLDAHRKSRQADDGELTITAMYNVLERLREGRMLTAKERNIHDRGLVSVLRSLHDDIDQAVLAAYGWEDLWPLMRVANGLATPGEEGTPASRAECRQMLDDTVLERLVALNAARVAEEASGHVRWLRPEFQKKSAGEKFSQQTIDTTVDDVVAPANAERRRWPTGLPDQIKAVSDVLAASGKSLSLEDIASAFSGRGRWRDRLPTILTTLESLGMAQQLMPGAWRHLAVRRA